MKSSGLVERKVDDQVEVFEGALESQLRQYFEERRNNSGVRKWLDRKTFAILHERSTSDNTLVVHYEHTELGELCEALYKCWASWRVRFSEAENLIDLLEFCPEFWYTTFSQSDRFIGEDGIFPVNFVIEKVAQDDH